MRADTRPALIERETPAAALPPTLPARDLQSALGRLEPLARAVILWRYAGGGGARLREDVELLIYLGPAPRPTCGHRVRRLAELALAELAHDHSERPDAETCARWLGVGADAWKTEWAPRYAAVTEQLWEAQDRGVAHVRRRLAS